jgi:hypothetical protein
MMGSGFIRDTIIELAPIIKVEDVVYINERELKVRLKAIRSAGSGPRDVTVKNPNGEFAVLKNGLEIKAE